MSKLCDLFLNMITKIVNGWWYMATRAVVLFMGFRHIGCNCFPLCYWNWNCNLIFFVFPSFQIWWTTKCCYLLSFFI